MLLDSGPYEAEFLRYFIIVVNFLSKTFKRRTGMKKIIALSAVFVACTAFNASAGTISSNQTASCNDAKSITLEVANIPFENKGANGYTSNDRGSANVAVWKSSNFTTVPIALGAKGDNNAALRGQGKLTKFKCKDTTQCVPGAIDNMSAGVSEHFYSNAPGKNKVVLTSQPEFSRGDSIGDISGLVKITNNGSNPVTVTCN
jgi:hypothetical protein